MKYVVLLLMLGQSTYGLCQETIEAFAEINKSIATQKQDLDIKITITSRLDSAFLIYKYGHSGNPTYYRQKSYFEIQKRKKNRFVKVTLNDAGWASELPVPLFDSLGNFLDDVTDTLLKGKPYILYFNPVNVYYFTKGTYRVRLCIQILRISNQPYQYVRSNWLTFAVESKVIDPF